jgi:hypothetical protein
LLETFAGLVLLIIMNFVSEKKLAGVQIVSVLAAMEDEKDKGKHRKVGEQLIRITPEMRAKVLGRSIVMDINVR